MEAIPVSGYHAVKESYLTIFLWFSYNELQTGILLVEVVKQVVLLVFVDTRQSIVDQAKNQKDARSSNCCNKIFATTAETGDLIAVP